MVGKVLWRYSDGTVFRSYVRIYDDYGNRIDGNPDTRSKGIRTTNRIQHFGNRESIDLASISQRPKRGTLKLILAAIKANRERENRRRIMRIARENRSAQVKAQRESSPALTYPAPLESLQRDIREGIEPAASETVTETYKLDIGDRHYLRFQIESPAYLVHLERLYRDYLSQRRITESVARANGKPTGNLKASRPWKESRGVATFYLTQNHLSDIAVQADGEVQIHTENTRGIVCVSYKRRRGYRVHAIVARHLRESAAA